MQFLSILLFYTIFYLVGRGIFIFVSKINNFKFEDNYKLFEIEIKYFYTVIALIFLGNFNFLINFFKPITNISTYFFICFFILFNLFKSFNFKKKYDILFSFLILFILSISTFDIGFQYDAGYYHLNFQNWIRSEKIIFGLSNLHTAHALSSINDYLSASFWVNGNFIYLHYQNLIFLTTFYSLLFRYLTGNSKRYKYGSLGVIIFALLDNFGVNGGRNGFLTIQGIGKPDVIFGIVFFLASIYIFFLHRRKSTVHEIIFLYVLVLYSFQLKQFGAVLLIYFFSVLYKLIKEKKLEIKNLLKPLLSLSLILFPWIIKGLILSGCLLFPLEFTCIDFTWYQENTALDYSTETARFNNAFYFDISFFNWLQSWLSVELNNTVAQNFLFSLLVIYISKNLLFKKLRSNNNSLSIEDIVYITLTIIVWIFGSPHPRFLFGFLTFVSFIIFATYENLEFRYIKYKKYLNLIFILFFTISVLLTPRISSYYSAIDQKFNIVRLNEPKVEFYNYYKSWVMPTDGDQCWSNLNCLENYVQIKEKIKSGYKIFTIDN